MGTVQAAQGLAINGRGSLNSDPTRNFRFLVEFQPYGNVKKHPMATLNFGFTSVSGLSMAIESIPYREGGMNTTLHQIPGQATFSPITLTRGIHLGNSQAWAWARKLFAAIGPNAQGFTVGAPAYQFRSSVTIHVLQHPVKMGNDSGIPYSTGQLASRNDPVAVSFRAYNAWITALAYSDLNAGDNAIMVEQMTLVHEGFDMYWDKDISDNVNQTAQTLAGVRTFA